jgi:hypothetical protein
LSLREHTSFNDDVSINVKRAGNKSKNIRRFFGLSSLPKGFKESTFGDGWLTAIKVDGKTGQQTILCKDKHNLLTNGGRDFFHVQCYGSSGLGTNGTNYVAVTATAVTPAAGDTTLSGELAVNGFTRAQGTVAHTNGTNATTVTITFTATGTQNTVQASALFTAVSSGTMSHEATFTSTNFAANDQLQIVWTLNLG